MELKKLISREACALGFSAFGVASADYDPVGHEHLLRWIDRNYHAEMNYMERATRKRFDPRIHLPGARSVIVCALNYYNKPNDDPSKPYVSIYARGENYHKVVRNRLDLLSGKIRELAGERAFKVYVDSSAFAEKAFAVKAGLGFVGRNRLLILNRNDRAGKARGSFHFLGVIISELELEPDSTRAGTCGVCRLCIDACPTQAISSDGMVDAGRCISYHSMQNRGEIPEDIARGMGNIIFGCDICQLVCPFNRRAVETEEMRLRPFREAGFESFKQLSVMTEEEFHRRFGKSSVGELSYAQFKRNVAIAIDNSGNRRK